jgi:hypothetical protein
MAVTPNRHHTEVTDTPTRKAAANNKEMQAHSNTTDADHDV